MDNEFKVEFLHEHYNDTFTHLKGYLEKRDRLSIIIVVIIAALFLFSIDQNLTGEIANNWFNKKMGSPDDSQLIISYYIINSTLLVVLLINLLNYYRLINLISNQMSYLGELEAKINGLIGEENFITREGRQYGEQPIFIRGFSRFTYKTLFPVLLIVLISYNGWTNTMFSALDILVSVIIIGLTAFYWKDANKKLFKAKK